MDPKIKYSNLEMFCFYSALKPPTKITQQSNATVCQEWRRISIFMVKIVGNIKKWSGISFYLLLYLCPEIVIRQRFSQVKLF